MTIEEKAQKYDEAIERTESIYNETAIPSATTKGICTYIFPELKEHIESENEKIRKWLIALIKSNEYGSISNVGEMPCPKLNVLAWLEKQGNLMKALQTSNAEIGELIEKNYYLKEQVEKQGEQKSITMSLDEAIEHCKEKSCGNNACALEHKQLERWLTELKELKEQKPAWSEEDENRINRLIAYFEDKESFTAEDDVVYANWLKSLKPQSKYEQEESVLHWESGHPEPYKSVLILRHGNTVVEGEYNEETGRWYQYGFQHYLEDNEVIGWMDKKSLLGSFNSQLYWKPTEEQIKALDIAIRCGINPSTWEGDALRSLLEQLKQL